MRPILFVLPLLVIAGCCGMSSPSSSSSFCPLGTYGPACTDFCDKSAGTQFDGGPNCFSDCTGIVRQQGLGDATTCCRESISQQCQRSCTNEVSALVSRYGADAVPSEDQQEMLEECLGECRAPYLVIGMPMDSCSVLDFATMRAIVEGG